MKIKGQFIITLAIALCVLGACSATSVKDIQEMEASYTGTYDRMIAGPFNDNRSVIASGKNHDYYVAEDGIVQRDSAAGSNELLVAEKNIAFIAVSDNVIYYVDDESNLLKSFDIDARKTETVWDGQKYARENEDADFDGIAGLMIHDGILYMWDSGISIIKFSPETGAAEKFLSDVSKIGFEGNYAYYIDHAARTFSLYRMDLSSGKVELLRGDGKTSGDEMESDNKIHVDDLAVANGNLYYTTRFPGGLFRYNPAGGDTELTRDSDNFPECLSADGKDVYYVAGGDSKAHLHTLDTESEKITMLGDVPEISTAYGMYVTEDAAFYVDKNNAMRKLEIAKMRK
jgi:hypothetical protein